MASRATVGCLLTAAAIGTAWLSLAAQPRSIAITHVNVIDVRQGRVIPDSTVTVAGGLIAAVERSGPVPASALIVDGSGRFLIPGLWDMHAHTGGGTSFTGYHKAWLELYIAHGVTGVRDMGSDLDLVLTMRAATASGRALGPRILAAGPILDDAPGEWPLRLRTKTADDGVAAVRLLKRRGVDLIKVHDHTPREAFFAIAREARAQHLPLAGHVPIGLTPQEVIDEGQGDIEHLSNLQLWKPCSGGERYRRERCREFFEMLAGRHIWQTPTLVAMSEVATIGTSSSSVSPEALAYASQGLRKGWSLNQSFFATRPDIVQELKRGAQVGAVVTRDMADAGVGILAGCDMMIAGVCVHDELVAMVHGGMSTMQALQTATINPARYFRIEQSAGAIEPGTRADLVLLDANPLADIANVRRIRSVMVAGRYLDRRELDKMLAHIRVVAAEHQPAVDVWMLMPSSRQGVDVTGRRILQWSRRSGRSPERENMVFSHVVQRYLTMVRHRAQAG